jgi:hypothetical protein
MPQVKSNGKRIATLLQVAVQCRSHKPPSKNAGRSAHESKYMRYLLFEPGLSYIFVQMQY